MFSKIKKKFYLGICFVLVPALISLVICVLGLLFMSQKGFVPQDPIGIAGSYIAYTTLLFTILSIMLVIVSIVFGALMYSKKNELHDHVYGELKINLLEDKDFRGKVIESMLKDSSFLQDFIDQMSSKNEFRECISSYISEKFNSDSQSPKNRRDSDVDIIKGRIR